jgi:hypothetical protein
VQDAVNNDELPLAVNNHEPDAVRFPVRCQVSPLLSGVHWLPVVRCAFVACVISLVEWSILSAVHSHERDDNVALVVSMILVSFCFQCTNRMIHGACPNRSSIKLAFWQCC